jgi:chromosome segregation ATPase
MDVEKTIEFILDQQAQFQSDLAGLRGEVRDLTKEIRELTKEVRDLAKTEQRVTEGQDVIVGAIHGLIQTGQETRDLITADRQLIQELREEVKGTNDNLNVLIKVFIEDREERKEDRRLARELREDVQQTNDSLNSLVKVVDEIRRENGGRH